MMRIVFKIPGFCLGLFLISCESEEKASLLERNDYYDRQLEAQEERLEKASRKAETLKQELGEAEMRAEPSLKSIKARETMLAEMREAIGRLPALESEVEKSAFLLESYKAAFTPRSIPDGTSLGDITMVDGSSYKSVVVRRSAADQLNIAHSGGFAIVAVGNLPPEIRARILLAPVGDSGDLEPREVFSRKPAFIKSEGEHASDWARVNAEYDAARKDDQARRDAEREADRALREKQMAEREKEDQAAALAAKEKAAKMEEYRKTVSNLDQQLSLLSQALSEAQRQRDAFVYSSRGGSIRISEADLQRKIAPYEQRIRDIQAQIATINAQRAGLVIP